MKFSIFNSNVSNLCILHGQVFVIKYFSYIVGLTVKYNGKKHRLMRVGEYFYLADNVHLLYIHTQLETNKVT